MKTCNVEKISRRYHHGSPGLYRFLKRRMSKAMRRLGRLFLDDAPTRRATRGWSD